MSKYSLDTYKSTRVTQPTSTPQRRPSYLLHQDLNLTMGTQKTPKLSPTGETNLWFPRGFSGGNKGFSGGRPDWGMRRPHHQPAV